MLARPHFRSVDATWPPDERRSVMWNPRSMRLPTAPAATPRHFESHSSALQLVADIVLGMSDGLTVPFALAAGISGALAASHIVVVAGVAELAAGGISMGLGGYLAARTHHDYYFNEERRERREVQEVPDLERREIVEIFQRYGLEGDALDRAVDAVTSDHERWIDFMMRFELGLEKPAPGRDLRSALAIGGSYVAGGVVPLLPYMLIPTTHGAFDISAVVTLVALALFGIFKGRFTGVPPFKAAFQTVIVGSIAAAAAYAFARIV